MKAKEYIELIKGCETKEEIPSKVMEILSMFIVEIATLIEIRNAKTKPAIKSIITELNRKWIAFVSLLNKNNINTYGINVTTKTFYAAVIMAVPETKDMLREEINNIQVSKESSTIPDNQIRPYMVTPFNEIIKENINSEILCCLAALRNYHMAGLHISCMKPLVNRISFLRYWRSVGINYDEIELFEANNEEFLKDKLHLIN